MYTKIVVNKTSEKSKKYNNLDNFISIKKCEFEDFEKSIVTFLGFLLILFLAIKLTNTLNMIAYVLSGISFSFLLSIYVNFKKLKEATLELLYKNKDRLEQK